MAVLKVSADSPFGSCDLPDALSLSSRSLGWEPCGLMLAEALSDPSWMSSPVGWMGARWGQTREPLRPPLRLPVAVASCQLPPAVVGELLVFCARPSPLCEASTFTAEAPGFLRALGGQRGGRGAGLPGDHRPPVPAREGATLRRVGLQDGRDGDGRGGVIGALRALLV